MVKRKIYECKLCNIHTRLKTDFNRHENTKKHKKRVEMNEKLQGNIKNHQNPSQTLTNPSQTLTNPSQTLTNPLQIFGNKCNYCNKVFTRTDNLSRHIDRYCKKKVDTNEEKLLNYIKIIEKEKKNLSKKVEDLLIKSTTITNNKTINMQQNVIINSYGKENLNYLTTKYLTTKYLTTKYLTTKYLTTKYLTGLIHRPFDSVQSLLKTIHFNPKHPENHNIKISNKKQKYANVYNSGNWEFKNKKDVIENIVDNGFNIIECHYEDVKDKLESIKKDRFTDFQSNYDTNPTTKKTIESDMEMIILNGNSGEIEGKITNPSVAT
jgi:hypothetical protein